MQKSGRGKSARKPLVDISNARKKLSRDPSVKKVKEKEEQGERAYPKFVDGDRRSSLDRLLIAHSNLSDLIRQVDELIVQALKPNGACKMGIQEVESFICVLSDMHSTLMPWLPRFQQALSTQSIEDGKRLGQSSLARPDSTANKGGNETPRNSEELDLGSLISPSPLVSWRGGCGIENARQLFLLTPLPKVKTMPSKCPAPTSKIASEKVPHIATPCTFPLPPMLATSANSPNDSLGGVELKKISKNVESCLTASERTSDCCSISPPKSSNPKNREMSMLLVTPRLKMSPPKTCMFFEPVSSSFHESKNGFAKCVSSVGRDKDNDESLSCESSSSHLSGDLAMNYPELFGIQFTHKNPTNKQDVEASLDWFFSPPKTCTLLEPSDDNLRTSPAARKSNFDVCNQLQVNNVHAQGNKICSRSVLMKAPSNHGLHSSSLMAALQSTPMCKDLESTVRKGKQPGENTLKKELWTKFEAVSMHNTLRHIVSPFHVAEGKGFLDRLEEASSEDIGLGI